MITRKIELTISQKSKVNVDVEFPIYREHLVGDYCVIYTKISEDLSAIHITKNDLRFDGNEYGFEVARESRYHFDGSSQDYHLGKGVYALSREVFNEVLEELKRFVAEIGNDTRGGIDER